MTKLVFQLNTKRLESLNNDEKILAVLRDSPCPLPFNFLSDITKIKKCDLTPKVKSLEKFGLVKKATIQRSVFLKIGDTDGKT